MRQILHKPRISPQLSVIIPAYNQEKTIISDVKRIVSVLNNLNLTYEVIIVDDGSKDNTYLIAKKLKTHFVKVIRYDKNQGKGINTLFVLKIIGLFVPEI